LRFVLDGNVELMLHTFLTLTSDESECPTSDVLQPNNFNCV